QNYEFRLYKHLGGVIVGDPLLFKRGDKMENKKRVGYVRTDNGINQRATKKWLAIQDVEGEYESVGVGSYEELRSRLEDGSIYLAVVDRGQTVNGFYSPLREHAELFTDYQEVGNVDIL